LCNLSISLLFGFCVFLVQLLGFTAAHVPQGNALILAASLESSQPLFQRARLVFLTSMLSPRAKGHLIML
jgi:hypothetical protein